MAKMASKIVGIDCIKSYHEDQTDDCNGRYNRHAVTQMLWRETLLDETSWKLAQPVTVDPVVAAAAAAEAERKMVASALQKIREKAALYSSGRGAATNGTSPFSDARSLTGPDLAVVLSRYFSITLEPCELTAMVNYFDKVR